MKVENASVKIHFVAKDVSNWKILLTAVCILVQSSFSHIIPLSTRTLGAK